jgi:hypothetical protein
VPLQNRVDPWGRLHAVEARGAWMGNRGVLHDASKRIVRPWRLKAWILCRLQFKDRRRRVFAPARYSELFFLDEATAFAAGHRPCAECNRERFNEFKRAWPSGARAAEIDTVLHAERIADGEKVIYEARLDELPDGVMIEHEAGARLVLGKALYPWSFEGYGAPLPRPTGATRVRVLTPRSMVRAIAHGLAPQVHRSAEAGASETNRMINGGLP